MTNKQTPIIKLTYSDGIEALGTSYIDIATDYEKEIQETGRKLGATKAYSRFNKQAWVIKYDDKIVNRLTGSNGEC